MNELVSVLYFDLILLYILLFLLFFIPLYILYLGKHVSLPRLTWGFLPNDFALLTYIVRVFIIPLSVLVILYLIAVYSFKNTYAIVSFDVLFHGKTGVVVIVVVIMYLLLAGFFYSVFLLAQTFWRIFGIFNQSLLRYHPTAHFSSVVYAIWQFIRIFDLRALFSKIQPPKQSSYHPQKMIAPSKLDSWKKKQTESSIFMVYFKSILQYSGFVLILIPYHISLSWFEPIVEIPELTEEPPVYLVTKLTEYYTKKVEALEAENQAALLAAASKAQNLNDPELVHSMVQSILTDLIKMDADEYYVMDPSGNIPLHQFPNKESNILVALRSGTAVSCNFTLAPESWVFIEDNEKQRGYVQSSFVRSKMSFYTPDGIIDIQGIWQSDSKRRYRITTTFAGIMVEQLDESNTPVIGVEDDFESLIGTQDIEGVVTFLDQKNLSLEPKTPLQLLHNRNGQKHPWNRIE